MSTYLVKHASNSVPPMVTFRAPICGVVYGVYDMLWFLGAPMFPLKLPYCVNFFGQIPFEMTLSLYHL
jgi:hypothetical protein